MLVLAVLALRDASPAPSARVPAFTRRPEAGQCVREA